MSFTENHLYFDDFQVEDEWISLGRTVTETDVVNFAGLSGDFNPIHMDHQFARGTPFRGPIAHGLLVFGIIIQVLVWLMFNYMEDRARKLDPPPRPMALSEKERIPPEPRLQGAPGFGVGLGEGKQPIRLELKEPAAEYNEMRKIWDDDLKGLPDPRTGQASLPIEEAKQKVFQSGQLRTRPQADGQQQIDLKGLDVPSYQSSGRMTEKRDQ